MTQPRGDDGFFSSESEPDDAHDQRSSAAVVIGTLGALVVAGAMTLAIVFAFGEGAEERTVVPEPAQVSSQAVTPPSAASEGTTAPPESPSASPSATETATATPPPEPAHFVSPSGNIACTVAADGADCEIGDYDFEAPTAPECPDESGDWVEVTADGSAFLCHSGSKSAGSDVLDYGEIATVGDFSCESARSGVTCRHDPSGASFTIARAGIDVVGARSR